MVAQEMIGRMVIGQLLALAPGEALEWELPDGTILRDRSERSSDRASRPGDLTTHTGTPSPLSNAGVADRGLLSVVVSGVEPWIP